MTGVKKTFPFLLNEGGEIFYYERWHENDQA